jgi:hypothetical protein
MPRAQTVLTELLPASSFFWQPPFCNAEMWPRTQQLTGVLYLPICDVLASERYIKEVDCVPMEKCTQPVKTALRTNQGTNATHSSQDDKLWRTLNFPDVNRLGPAVGTWLRWVRCCRLQLGVVRAVESAARVLRGPRARLARVVGAQLVALPFLVLVARLQLGVVWAVAARVLRDPRVRLRSRRAQGRCCDVPLQRPFKAAPTQTTEATASADGRRQTAGADAADDDEAVGNGRPSQRKMWSSSPLPRPHISRHPAARSSRLAPCTLSRSPSTPARPLSEWRRRRWKRTRGWTRSGASCAWTRPRVTCSSPATIYACARRAREPSWPAVTASALSAARRSHSASVCTCDELCVRGVRHEPGCERRPGGAAALRA